MIHPSKVVEFTESAGGGMHAASADEEDDEIRRAIEVSFVCNVVLFLVKVTSSARWQRR